MSGQAHHRREDVVLALATEMLRSFGEVSVRGVGHQHGPHDISRRHSRCSPRDGPRTPAPATLCFSFGRVASTRIGWSIRAEDGPTIRLIARGDALDKNDPPFAENELLGRVAAVIRRGKRIDLDVRASRCGQRLLRWIAQRSDSSVKWLLRWHSLRGRLSPEFDCRPQAESSGSPRSPCDGRQRLLFASFDGLAPSNLARPSKSAAFRFSCRPTTRISAA